VLATHVPDAELAAHCRARLAPFKVPKAFVRVDELPRNAAGKVLKRQLRDTYGVDGPKTQA
jgi:fatty-acyl-CoA synthase